MAAMRQRPCDIRQYAPIYVALHKINQPCSRRKGIVMTNRKVFSAIGDFFTVFGSAVAASHAVEAGRKPRARDLRNLGMDPAAFNKIGRF
ncbi:hypothetical protein [Mesorhizobium sp.]|uniref:hypothetical protein n=1 Tax=Mesorhizobium sp. TaxID=1871066 RepID=UPI0025F65063|nr:hypothetical protein [Mesorhizobium sp.]